LYAHVDGFYAKPFAPQQGDHEQYLQTWLCFSLSRFLALLKVSISLNWTLLASFCGFFKRQRAKSLRLLGFPILPLSMRYFPKGFRERTAQISSKNQESRGEQGKRIRKNSLASFSFFLFIPFLKYCPPKSQIKLPFFLFLNSRVRITPLCHITCRTRFLVVKQSTD
jgi:hypothetical protein